MDDYYEILGVDRTASHEVIERTLRDQLRHWQQRTSGADLARRQEAERRVRQLAAARATLLDGDKRRQYDRVLPAPAPPPAPAQRERRRFDALPDPVPPEEWVEEQPAEGRYEPPESRLGSPYSV